VVNLNQQQNIPNHPIYRQNVLFAKATTLPTTKVVSFIKNYSNAVAYHPAQDLKIRNNNQHNPPTN
jgi:hypothetical protein